MGPATFFPTGRQHTPPTLGKWPLAWQAKGRDVDLRGLPWHPPVVRPLGHDDSAAGTGPGGGGTLPCNDTCTGESLV